MKQGDNTAMMFNMAKSPGHLNMIDESMLRKSKNNIAGGK